MTGRLALRPTIMSAREYARHQVGRYTVVFYDRIVSPDLVHYEYVAVLFAEGDGDPLMYFTSEKNSSPIPDLLRSIGVESGADSTGSHFLCVFDGDGHSNYGAADDWADGEKFKRYVLGEVAGAFGDAGPPA
jgi:hypothetical protein